MYKHWPSLNICFLPGQGKGKHCRVKQPRSKVGVVGIMLLVKVKLFFADCPYHFSFSGRAGNCFYLKAGGTQSSFYNTLGAICYQQAIWLQQAVHFAEYIFFPELRLLFGRESVEINYVVRQRRQICLLQLAV